MRDTFIKTYSMRILFFLLLTCFFTPALYSQEKPAGLSTGDTAPLFSGKDQGGNIISLQDQLKKGPVVLVFYRGYWCPYCNRYLKKLEDSLSLITGKGASLVTVTPEKPESINKTTDKTKASYAVVHDEGLQIMKKYGVNYAVDQKTIDQYKKYKIDFDEVNGSNGTNLPVPAVYVINSAGKIVYRFFNSDYTKRPTVAEILAQL
jgi:peroxiredoxin